MQFLGFLSVPVILLLCVVVPIWLCFHYVTKWKQMAAAGAEDGQTVVDRNELLRLREIAGALEERIDTLETILDAEVPQWRKR